MPMRTMLMAALLAGTPLATTIAAPASAAPVDAAQVAPMLADADRSADDRALDALRDPAKAIAFMAVEPGDRVLDVFAGAGYYSELLGRLVGRDGFVIAQNPAGFAERERIRTAVAARGYGGRLPNVAAMNRDFDAVGLAPNSLDAALFHLVYHDLYFQNPDMSLPQSDPQKLLAEINRALRPGGTVTVIDHVGARPQDPRTEVAAVHRIAPARVIQDFRKAGFDLVAEEIFFENPQDDVSRSVFDEPVRGKTNRFALRFAKAGDPNVRFIETETAMPDQPDSSAGMDAACDASAADTFVGQIYEEALKAQMVEAAGARTARVYDTDSAVTMDFRPDRLNIVTEPETRRILEVKCG